MTTSVQVSKPSISPKWGQRITATCLALLTAVTMMLTPVSAAQADPGGWHRVHHGSWQNGHGHKRHWKRHARENRQFRRQHNRAHHRHSQNYRSAHVNKGGLNGGHIIGGILGAVIGTQVGQGKGRPVAIIGGGLLGALIGGAVGNSMDHSDETRTQSVLESTPTGRSVEWTNPDSGATYTVTPTQTYDNGGTPCRDYTTWVFIDGYEEEAVGKACRYENGTWQAANNDHAALMASHRENK